jgi:hypothetical protein
VRARLTIVSLLAWIVVPASSALAASPQRPAASSTGIGIRLVGARTDSGNSSLGDSYIVDRVAPGTAIRRRIEITNDTSATAIVAVYPAAASLRRGTFVFGSGHSQNALSGWTSVSRGVLRLPPGAKTFETVTINVPKGATKGEHYAVVWAEVTAAAPATGGVTLVNRVGVRMYLSIGAGGAPPAKFAIGSLTAERTATGEPLVVARIRNSGRRTLDIGGTLALSRGPGGLRAGPFHVTPATALAPGDSERVTVLLDKRLPRGPWRAHLTLRSGPVERTAVATITFPRHIVVAKPAGSSRDLVLEIMIGLVSLAVAAFAFLLSRTRRTTISRTPE